MNSNEFRKELVKIMPGYKWTVHRQCPFSDKLQIKVLSATGIKTSGFNRLSTLKVTRREKDNISEYEVKSSGFGLRTPWLSSNKDVTLARALRGLQDYYQNTADNYRRHAMDLQSARQIKSD